MASPEYVVQSASYRSSREWVLHGVASSILIITHTFDGTTSS